jgi:hypothetical protein
MLDPAGQPRDGLSPTGIRQRIRMDYTRRCMTHHRLNHRSTPAKRMYQLNHFDSSDTPGHGDYYLFSGKRLA